MMLILGIVLFLVLLGFAILADARKCREVRRAMAAARAFELPVYLEPPARPVLRDLSDFGKPAAIPGTPTGAEERKLDVAEPGGEVARQEAASAAPNADALRAGEPTAIAGVIPADPQETSARALGATPENSEDSTPEIPAPAEPIVTSQAPARDQCSAPSEPPAVESQEAVRNAQELEKREPASAIIEREAAAKGEAPALVKTETRALAPKEQDSPKPAHAEQGEKVLEVRVQPEGSPTVPPENVARLVVEQLFQAGFSTQLQESVAGADIWVKRPGDTRHSIKITVGTGSASQPTYGIGAPLGEVPNPENPKPGHIVVQLPGPPRRS